MLVRKTRWGDLRLAEGEDPRTIGRLGNTTLNVIVWQTSG